MVISKVEILEPEEYVAVKDGIYEVIAFSDEITYSDGDCFCGVLNGMGVKNIVLSIKGDCRVTVLDNTYRQHIVAKLSDKKAGVVTLGNITIKLNTYMPNDIMEKDLIKFEVARLDME